MSTYFFIISMSIGLGYLIGRHYKAESLGHHGATSWKDHMWCQKCKTVYPQYGFHPSVYNCPECGDETTFAVARYVDGKLEVKKR